MIYTTNLACDVTGNVSRKHDDSDSRLTAIGRITELETFKPNLHIQLTAYELKEIAYLMSNYKDQHVQTN